MTDSAAALPACCYAAVDASPAEKAYAAYNAAGNPETAGLNYAGLPCPTWAMLTDNVRAKWLASVLSVEDPFMENIYSRISELAGGGEYSVEVVLVHDAGMDRIGTIGVHAPFTT